MRFPIFYENSRIPVWLSRVSPIEIGAISLGIFVFSRGEVSERTRRHEIIHYCQWKELGFVGFALLYPLLWIREVIRGGSRKDAYRSNPLEIEAYEHDGDPNYLCDRSKFAWVKYL